MLNTGKEFRAVFQRCDLLVTEFEAHKMHGRRLLFRFSLEIFIRDYLNDTLAFNLDVDAILDTAHLAQTLCSLCRVAKFNHEGRLPVCTIGN